MKYKVKITKQVKKTIEKQQKHIKKAFNNWIKEELPNKPYDANDGMVKNIKIEGYQAYKKRFGNFRAILTIKDDIVIVEVHKLKPRGQVYKKNR